MSKPWNDHLNKSNYKTGKNVVQQIWRKVYGT